MDYMKQIYAWDDCPRGLIDDPAPGECRLYTDTDGNQICDHSESAPSTTKTTTEKSVKTNYYFWEISVVLIFLYILSTKFIKNFRKYWNWVLLIEFFILAINSLVLFFGIYSKQISFVHIELGLIFIMTSLFHALWHWRYYR